MKLVIPPFHWHQDHNSSLFGSGAMSFTGKTIFSHMTKMAPPLSISEPNMETYDNFGIFGFSIVDNLGYTSVLNKSEHFWFFCTSMMEPRVKNYR